MDLASQAIDAALRRNWQKAIELNNQLIKQNPKDLDALNRLGRAYLETGDNTKAAQIYGQVLKSDKYNTIAVKGLHQTKNHKRPTPGPTSANSVLPIFLEEPGVTKTVTLIRLGDTKMISQLYPGDAVNLVVHEHSVSVVNSANQYIGRLPDDLASRLRPFMKSGNTYSAWIRSLDSAVKIFIKEIFRSVKYRSIPSFPLTEKMSYAAFTPPELVHGAYKVDVSTPEEDTDEQRRPEPDIDSDTDAPPPHGFDDN